MPMGWTSENVAGDFNVSREEMDAYAALSFQRAEKAQKEGWFADEIVPFTVTVKDAKTGSSTVRTIEKDDGIRYGTTQESLLKIRPAFPQWGPSRTTGGNASQITDGAAAVLLMRRSRADALGVKVIGKFVTTAVAGVPPRVMGVGPLYAIRMVLEATGLAKDDVALYEVSWACCAAMHGRVWISTNGLANWLPLDQRGVCVPVCVLREGARSRCREGERERRSDRSGPPVR